MAYLSGLGLSTIVLKTGASGTIWRIRKERAASPAYRSATRLTDLAWGTHSPPGILSDSFRRGRISMR